MHSLNLLHMIISALLFTIFSPALSFHVSTFADQKQAAASHLSLLRGRSGPYAMSTYIHQPWSPHASFRKRSGQPVGVGITLHALWVTAYAGVRAVLVNLYVKVINEAASHPPGTATGYLLAGYGEVIMEFASDRPMRWDVIEFFARMMLERVLNGEQNFYIADIVTEFPGALGQQTIHFLMASPATASDTADEAWAGVLQNWLLRVGIGS